MANLLKGQPGDTYVLEQGFSGEFHIGTADDDGIIRNEKGESFSPSYDVVAEVDRCYACSKRNHSVEKWHLDDGVPVCSDCA